MSDPAKKSCTIRELARHVGLSTCTVSRVLNHRSGELPIPEKTQERIREAARALNYVPNVNAQRFFKRRSNVIGLLVPPQEEMGHNAFNDTHFVEILSGIEKALCRTGYNLLLLFNRPEFQENNHYAGLFQSGFLDGLLIWGVHRSDRYWNELAALSGPRIFLTSLPGAEGSASLSFVASDYEHSAFGIVSHLREKGRRSFCWLAGKEDTSIIPQLEAGIRRAGVRIPPEAIRYSDYTEADGERLAAELLATGRYDAVVATAPQLARGASRCIAARYPAAAVGCFDGQSSTRLATDRFITALTNDYEIGVTALEKLVARIEGGKEPVQLKIPVTFAFSETTGRAE